MKKELVRSEYIRVWLRPKEVENLKSLVSNSTCRTISEYGRKLLINLPIVIYYRNKSFDEFMDTSIELRREIQDLLRQPLTMANEERLIQLYREIKEGINQIMDQCSPK